MIKTTSSQTGSDDVAGLGRFYFYQHIVYQLFARDFYSLKKSLQTYLFSIPSTMLPDTL